MARRHRTLAAVVFLVSIVMSGVGSTVVLAQNPPPAQGVPAQLEDVRAILAALQTSVDQIQDSLDTPPPEENTRVTAPTNYQTGVLTCFIANVSGAHKTVLAEVRNAAGGVVGSATFSLGTGVISGIGMGISTYTGFVNCKFTVQDGTKADIRGSLNLSPTNNANPLVVIPAD